MIWKYEYIPQKYLKISAVAGTLLTKVYLQFIVLGKF